MKDCCKTGSETKQKRSGFKKWFNYTIYAIIAIIVIGVLILQLTGD
ncbi:MULTISPECIES: hypothetical protein [Flavobacteriaceae]|jgi:hypothetical protein|uniref:Uncharacterized protein n=6 Tax=Flavobacteriaceae TaxID=49546 RepID=I3C2A7_9FLAO|nr:MULTISPECIES: hypothetical protein [Flavobacteriaceae]EIJ37750.1 hypothetical protein JoomaDRAFT_0715 [Galbibacter orientalis DSM 19592]ADF54554.1 hypothetical protein ZPR_4251 [Zunongwangia profunda SM-A87]MCC4226983.1 hypothetical protein [Zunongwangia profunda]RXG19902.1 hypothetical protein DSM02_2923 [Leeuwenhoekiella polynyae]RXG21581.1 hypothetical protein DSM00_2430 [Leeuwenhoekiella aequorea]|tara:strand:- start:7805 stop:7942 length:138 start_codon:yes stop_codon:yes gene_type:complete